MNADQELKSRFERAARVVEVDPDRRLAEVRAEAGRRGRARRLRALAVAAVVAVIVAVLAWQLRSLGGSSHAPASSSLSGRIAYLDTGKDSEGLFALEVASGKTSALHSGTGILCAAWSPDGSRLAYALEEPGGDFAVFVAEGDGTNPAKVVDAADSGAVGPDISGIAWSPDGTRFAYAGRVVTDGVARRTILIVDAYGGGDPVVFDGHWESVSWSPDGRLLMSGFPDAGVPDGRFDLYTSRPDGSDLRQLTDDASIERSATWSPDGSRIAFADGPDATPDVYVMNADGGNLHRLTDPADIDISPVWSPDGRAIAFSSDRGATREQRTANRSGESIWAGMSTYVVEADGSGATLLLDAWLGLTLPLSWGP